MHSAEALFFLHWNDDVDNDDNDDDDDDDDNDNDDDVDVDDEEERRKANDLSKLPHRLTMLKHSQ